MSTSRLRRRSLASVVALVVSGALAVVPAPAQAADRTPFVVIGTSDVSDSGLVAAVIEPGFEAAYPQYDLQYIPKGTGAALTDARNGLAAAAIVHAAAIENQFVGDGYSMEEFGRLVFWGDYILLGPNDDPANVGTLAPDDIVKALELVAAAGAAGTVDFTSRGGTPGTAVQERALWALTSGVPTCNVANASGGGTRPKAADSPSTTCSNPNDTTYNPGGGDSDGAPYPSWYHTGSSTSQAENVNIANQCSTASNPSGKCYVFTDRGTYKNLKASGGAQNLKIVTRDNSPSARGGRDALINVFHAYGINPDKFPNPATTKTDPVAAKLFLDWITSPSVQSAMGAHLAGDGDAAFIPSAAPTMTGGFASTEAAAGKPTRITGNIANVVPGYPALNGVTVKLRAANGDGPLDFPVFVRNATTDATGNFTFNEDLAPGKFYSVAVDQFSKVEIPTLSPAFGSILVGNSVPVGTVGGVTLTKVKRTKAGALKVKGTVASAESTPGLVRIYGAKQGKKMRQLGKVVLAPGKTKAKFTKKKITKGTWKFELVYENPGAEILKARSFFEITTFV